MDAGAAVAGGRVPRRRRGSPVHATLGVERRTSPPIGPALGYRDQRRSIRQLPLEVHVEREAVALRLRGSVQLGLYFETLVRAGGVATSRNRDRRVPRRVSDRQPPSRTRPTRRPTRLRFRALAAGRVTDGEALYASARRAAAGQAPRTLAGRSRESRAWTRCSPILSPIAIRCSASRAGLRVASRATRLRLRARFSAAERDPRARGAEFPGGHLDWYSFTLRNEQPNAVFNANPAQVTPASFDFLPNHVVFRGMPDARWWNFEDAVTDFGQLDAEHVDLAKLLVMEFALVYGNDCFTVPVPIPVGMSGADAAPRSTLSRVTTLVVTDTFGVRTLIRPSEQTQVNAGERPWSVFKVSGQGTRSDFILMAPTLGVTDDSEPLEEVLFLRDDMAAMAWAVEHKLHGDLDCPIDAYEMYLERIKGDPPPSLPTATTGGPSIYYTLETMVPDNWIPLVPVRTPQGTPYLRRGTMEVPTSSGFLDIKARALILEPGHPYFVQGRMLSRAGLKVARYFRRTRSSNGSTFVWMARKTGQGRGPGASGLQFDLVRNMHKP